MGGGGLERISDGARGTCRERHKVKSLAHSRSPSKVRVVGAEGSPSKARRVGPGEDDSRTCKPQLEDGVLSSGRAETNMSGFLYFIFLIAQTALEKQIQEVVRKTLGSQQGGQEGHPGTGWWLRNAAWAFLLFDH